MTAPASCGRSRPACCAWRRRLASSPRPPARSTRSIRPIGDSTGNGRGGPSGRLFLHCRRFSLALAADGTGGSLLLGGAAAGRASRTAAGGGCAVAGGLADLGAAHGAQQPLAGERQLVGRDGGDAVAG